MHKQKPAITQKYTIKEGNFLKFISIEYVNSVGKVRKWESFERINCKGIVVIVPVTHEKHFILTRQFRPPVNSYVIEFPAGLNDMGESLLEAAQRELREETGYRAQFWTFLTEGPMSSGASGEILTVYMATQLEYVGIAGRDEAEQIETIDIPLSDIYTELPRLQEQGNFIDLKIYGLADLAKRNLPRLNSA